MNAFNITHHTLAVPSTGENGGSISFAHISDLHLRRWAPKHEELVQAINDRAPDFVFITGDFTSQSDVSMDVLSRLLGALKSRRGVLGVRGNWEVLHGPPLRHLRSLFASRGGELLVNESRHYDTPAGRIHVAGLDDICLGAPDIQRATAQTETGDISLLLSHAPVTARLLGPENRIDLVLSGHTHAGQVRVPLLWRLFLPRWNGGLIEGLYDLPSTRVYVNRGFGSVGILPLRFRCDPELAMFEIRSIPRSSKSASRAYSEKVRAPA